MASVKRVIIPYAPRRVFLPFHERKQRFAVGVAHRRCGKTVACINDKIARALKSGREGYRAAYIAPFLRQAKDVAWDYLKRYSYPVLAAPPNESELFVPLINGARIRIYGADNPDALRGGYLDDVTLDEFADMRPGVWGEIIRPMLADRQGSATFIGTPKGKNTFFDLYERAKADPENWFSFMLRASETGLIAQEELAAARIEMTQGQYDQEFECSFDANLLYNYFKAEWLLPVDNLPPRDSLRVYGGSDYAVTAEGGDYTVHAALGLDADGNPWLLDLWRKQACSDEWVAAFCDLVRKWRPMAWAEETGQIKSGVGPWLEREMRARQAYTAREQFPTRGDKAIRAQSFRGLIATRSLRIPASAAWRSDFEAELLRFPAGVHDDIVDSLALIGQLLDKMLDGPKRVAPEAKKIDEYREWAGDHDSAFDIMTL